uniref:HDC08932 n=1 Tax=Drosophila melanogaster TaxID=7227 RepID=Q6ILM5_DROME|nr:TPA_inf: HDC08932 [Drosophila melanogaster]
MEPTDDPGGFIASAPVGAYHVIVIFIGCYYRPAGVHNAASSYSQVLSRKLFKWREEDEVLDVLQVLPHVAE